MASADVVVLSVNIAKQRKPRPRQHRKGWIDHCADSQEPSGPRQVKQEVTKKIEEQESKTGKAAEIKLELQEDMKREVKEEASKDVQKKVKTEITQESSKDIKVEVKEETTPKDIKQEVKEEVSKDADTTTGY
eukprot:s958_g2.t2